MKRTTRWILLGSLSLLLVGGITRAILHKKAIQTELAQSSASVASRYVALQEGDWITVQPMALIGTVPVTGTVKAVTTAMVKAKVAAELLRLTVREGDTVTKGQLIGELDPQEYQARLKQAQEQAASAKALYQIAQQALDNNKALVQQGFISKVALDNSISNAASSFANQQAAEAAVELARKSLQDTHLLAPISGQVSQRLTQPGERVSIDGRIVEIVDLSKLELEAGVSPQDLVTVRIGHPVVLRIEGLDKPVTGHIARINPTAAAATRAISVYVALDTQAGLRHGLFAQGAIRTDRLTALALPRSVIRSEGGRQFVQVVRDDKVVRQTVETGRSALAADPNTQLDAVVIILRGLKAGDRVLKDNVGLLAEGTPVQLARQPGKR